MTGVAPASSCAQDTRLSTRPHPEKNTNGGRKLALQRGEDAQRERPAVPEWTSIDAADSPRRRDIDRSPSTLYSVMSTSSEMNQMAGLVPAFACAPLSYLLGRHLFVAVEGIEPRVRSRLTNGPTHGQCNRSAPHQKHCERESLPSELATRAAERDAWRGRLESNQHSSV